MKFVHRFGIVSISGPPNSGKSTLFNNMIGEKISVVSRLPNVTRHKILGIKNMNDAQMVCLDTPGIHRGPNYHLNKIMNKTAIHTLREVDLILFMIDYKGWVKSATHAFKYIQNTSTPIVLLINKIDCLRSKQRLLPMIEESANMFHFKEIIPISARFIEDTDRLINQLVHYLPEGNSKFSQHIVTDRSKKFLLSELIREQTLIMLRKELPYSTAVKLTNYEYNTNNSCLYIDAIILVKKPSQKAIIIGRGGKLIKYIGKQARLKIEKSVGHRVFLTLWVKVMDSWDTNNSMLKSIGYLSEK